MQKNKIHLIEWKESEVACKKVLLVKKLSQLYLRKTMRCRSICQILGKSKSP